MRRLVSVLVKSVHLFCTLCILSACEAVSGFGQEVNRVQNTSNTEDLLEKLVQDLSSSEFLVREKATERLADEFDYKAIPEMERHLAKLKDLESSVRLSAIVTRLKADRQRTLIRNFKRSKNPDETFGFEGWRTFSKYSGKGRSSKDLFLMLMDKYPELVEKEFPTKEAALKEAKRIASIIGESFGMLTPPGQVSALALMYCVAASEDLYDRELDQICRRTFSYFEFKSMLLDPRNRKSLEPMISSWAVQVTERRTELLYFLITSNLAVARDVAINVLNSSEKEDELAFLFSMQALYKFGRIGDLPLVEKWLDDKTELDRDDRFDDRNPNAVQPVPFTIQRRDAALLVAMRLTGEDPTNVFKNLVVHDVVGFVAQSIFLPQADDEQRTKRVDGWRAAEKAKAAAKQPITPTSTSSR